MARMRHGRLSWGPRPGRARWPPWRLRGRLRRRRRRRLDSRPPAPRRPPATPPPRRRASPRPPPPTPRIRAGRTRRAARGDTGASQASERRRRERRGRQADVLVLGRTSTRPAPTRGSPRRDAYQTAHPNITIEVVEQATDTFIATFQSAAAAKSGPDIAAQWATGPVLTQAWAGAITPISDLVPPSEIAHWLNTSENTYDGKLWAMPLYLIGDPLGLQQGPCMAQAGLTEPPATWDDVIVRVHGAAREGHHAVRVRQRLLLDDAADGAEPHCLQDVVDASTGKASFTDPKFAAFEDGWKAMVDAKCFNDDVASVGISQAGTVRRRQGGHDHRHRRQRAAVGQGPRRRAS